MRADEEFAGQDIAQLYDGYGSTVGLVVNPENELFLELVFGFVAEDFHVSDEIWKGAFSFLPIFFD